MLAGPQPELPNADRIVLDGELVIVGENGLDFEALQLRIHPAQSRVRLLAASTPVTCVAFDLLAAGTEDFRDLPLGARRERLQELLAGAEGQILLTPITRDPVVAAQWFEHFEGAGLDGVIAKKWSQKVSPWQAGLGQSQAPADNRLCRDRLPME